MVFKMPLSFPFVRTFVHHAIKFVHFALDVALPIVIAQRTRINIGFSRFFRFGHTPGTMDVQAPVASREFPFTIDLRRV